MTMLAAKRLSLVRKIFWSTLGVSAIFGVNAFLFAFKRSEVQNIANIVENSEALRHSLTTDIPLYSFDWQRLPNDCRQPSSSQCEDAVATLIMLRNRNEDYKVVITKSFGVTDIHNDILSDLDISNNLIDSTFSEGFGLSLNSSKALGIVDPSSYLQTIIKRGGLSSNVLVQMSPKLGAASRKAFHSLNQYEKAQRPASKDFRTVESQVNIIFTILIVAELLVFILVSSIDLWNNNVS